jgi:nucleotide-binding universal stress UspA family protein
MMTSPAFARIVWAVDPFEEPSKLRVPLLALKYLVQSSEAVIQPIYVASRATDRSERLSRKAPLEALFKGIHQKNLLPPLLIETTSLRAHQATDALIARAQALNTDLIVAGTHHWNGLNRFFNGSFVESLLNRSPIPVLSLGPGLKEVRPFERVLYASHLTPQSIPAFRQAVSLAVCFRSELTVVHLLSRRERDLAGDDSTGVGERLPARSRLSRRSRAWANWAMREGVATEVVIADAENQVYEQILQEALRRHSGLIILETHSGPLASFLKGNKIRQIARGAQCPVMVVSAREASLRFPPGAVEEELMLDLLEHGRRRNVA